MAKKAAKRAAAPVVAPAAPAKKAKPAKKAAAKPAAVASDAKPQFDSRGIQFDAAQHATGANKEPHRDSAGNFVRKSDHYEAPKAAGRGSYPDSFRHE
jgi:hypothetical protein